MKPWAIGELDRAAREARETALRVAEEPPDEYKPHA
jgi:hypothetical protein